MAMLHFAPEPFFRSLFSSTFATYETADLNRPDVDHHVDLQKLPFGSELYDAVYASHVLEHVRDDRAALNEIWRVLRPGGVAILPVPIVTASTVEYAEPNPVESMHVRAPGLDYFDRYRDVFSRVDVFDSSQFSEEYQLHVYEQRSTGVQRLPDYVPIAYR